MTPPRSEPRFNLKAWRFDNGVTRVALSRSSGVPLSTIVSIENEGRSPNASTGHALARVVGRPASELWLADEDNRSEARA